MFSFFSKKPQGEKAQFTVTGMHCTSCAMNIDGALEETPGVLHAETNYARSVVTVSFDPTKTDLETIQKEIAAQGYGSKLRTS